VKTIHYADHDITTTDETADAVLAYAQALALAGRSDTVHVHGVDEDGEAREFDLLIGPSSQIIASSTGVELDGVTDDAGVAEITARTKALVQNSGAVSGGVLEDFVDLDDYDTH
jgi:hypothetical protein